MVLKEAVEPTVIQPEGAEVRLAASTVATKGRRAEKDFMMGLIRVKRSSSWMLSTGYLLPGQVQLHCGHMAGFIVPRFDP